MSAHVRACVRTNQARKQPVQAKQFLLPLWADVVVGQVDLAAILVLEQCIVQSFGAHVCDAARVRAGLVRTHVPTPQPG